jgi:hypothetical protein
LLEPVGLLRPLRERRSRVDWKCPLRISSSLTRLLDKNRYAAFVFAQSWQTNGMLSPTPPDICSRSISNLFCKRTSLK